MKTDDELIRDIAAELCITEGQVIFLWKEAFSKPKNLGNQWACDTADVKKQKTLTTKVLDRLAKAGRLEKRTVFCAKSQIRGYEVSEYPVSNSNSNTLLNPPRYTSYISPPTDEKVPTWEDLFDTFVLPEPEPVGRYTAQGAAFERQQHAKWDCDHIIEFSVVGTKLLDLMAQEPRLPDSWLTRLNRFFIPISEIEKEFGPEIFREAVDRTLAAGKGAPGYVRAVAERLYREKEKAAAPRPVLSGPQKTFRTDDGRECGELDTWALEHPVYRERYIACFGEPDA